MDFLPWQHKILILWELLNSDRLDDQSKEKKPKAPTIREKFHTYKFADYKAQGIDLLQRGCTVSIRTMEIIQQMPDTVTVKHQGEA